MKAHELLIVRTADKHVYTYYLPPGAAVEHLAHHVMMAKDTHGAQHVWHFRNVIGYSLRHVPETPGEGN